MLSSVPNLDFESVKWILDGQSCDLRVGFSMMAVMCSSYFGVF